MNLRFSTCWLFILILTACGGRDVPSPARTQPQDQVPQQQQAPDQSDADQFWASEFETRLSANLLIAGALCQGGEIVEAPDAEETQECAPGQWQVTVDDQNTCTADGICTQIFVPPVVARLERERSTDRSRFYEIKPEQAVSSGVSQILDDHWVRFRRDQQARVLKRD
jgi:uncharacterized lipoprotein YmbA